ncbi:MAG: C1 family peptidase [Prolixibacteraceae bacterium]|nr:C1 family peptidase [Prolixibacteraceae bacterium]
MKDFSQYKLNVTPSPKDKRDWKVSAIYPKVALPEIVDYRPVMFPIRDQGSQGSCAAMSGAAMKEWQEHIDVNMNDYMSPQFIYNNRENINEEGMYMRDLMEVLKEKGDCTESVFPYGTKGLPSIEVLMNASLYKISNYGSIDTINDLKTSLFSNGPCVIAIPVYNYTERMWFKNKGEYLLGGHALCVVGYNKEGFIIRNSWGADWGKEGYCVMSYDDFGMQYELWTTVDSKSFDPPVPPEPPIPPEPKKKGCLAQIFGF